MYHLLLCCKNLCILHTGCIHGFRKLSKLNSNYFTNSTNKCTFLWWPSAFWETGTVCSTLFVWFILHNNFPHPWLKYFISDEFQTWYKKNNFAITLFFLSVCLIEAIWHSIFRAREIHMYNSHYQSVYLPICSSHCVSHKPIMTTEHNNDSRIQYIGCSFQETQNNVSFAIACRCWSPNQFLSPLSCVITLTLEKNPMLGGKPQVHKSNPTHRNTKLHLC
jgi:hypothetical protein